MSVFGKRSLNNLAQLHPDMQKVMREAIKYNDFTIICGHRGKVDQETAFKSGNSQAKWLQSPHNFKPALAVDCVPYPLDWNNIAAFELMGRVIMNAATRVGVKITWGKNFKGLRDYPHFELADWKNRV